MEANDLCAGYMTALYNDSGQYECGWQENQL